MRARGARRARRRREPLRTFSIGFEERSFDETGRRARWSRSTTATDHHELVLRPDAARLLPALADAFDEPFADSSALPTYLVSRARRRARQGRALRRGRRRALRRLLHLRGRPARRARRRPRARSRARSSSCCRPRPRKASLDYRAKRFVRAAHLPPLERHHGWKEIFSADARAELTGRRDAFDPVDLLRARFAETEGAELVSRLQDVDLGVLLVDDLLAKTDRASMAHSLESRVPFLDPVVTNLALALPTREKVRGLRKKVLLRKAVAPLLPARIVHGRKRGFSIPAAAWLRGELEPFARDVALAGDAAPPGLLRAGRGHAPAGRARRGPRGPLPPALGTARVHALARAARRAHRRRRQVDSLRPRR